jgi:hypothetical protein
MGTCKGGYRSLISTSLGPEVPHLSIKHFEFLPISAGRFLAVFIAHLVLSLDLRASEKDS